jgi:hypothetical protein
LEDRVLELNIMFKGILKKEDGGVDLIDQAHKRNKFWIL